MFGRIMAVVVAVIVLLTSVLSGLGLYTLTSRQTAIRQENLRAEAREIAYLASLYSGGSSTYTLGTSLFSGSAQNTVALKHLRWKAAQVYDEYGAYIAIVDRSGQVMDNMAVTYEKNPDFAKTLNGKDIYEALLTIIGGDEISIRRQVDGDWYFTVGVPFVSGGLVRGAVFIQTPAQEIEVRAGTLLLPVLGTMNHKTVLQYSMTLVIYVLVRCVTDQFVRGVSRRRFAAEPKGKTFFLNAAIAAAVMLLVYLVVHPAIMGLLYLMPKWLERTLVIAGVVLILADFVGVMRTLRTSSATRLNKAGQETTQRMADRISSAIWRRLQKAYPGLTAADVPGPERYVFARGICFDKLVWVFLVTSFLGALIEMVFCRVTSGQWMSRSGVLYGSFSFVWGLGAVVLTITLQRVADKPDRRIFLAGFVIGGAYEYLCSVFTELVFGTVFWDYSKMPLNIGGRTNVLYCIFWGLLAVAWIKVLYPPMSKGIEKIPALLGKVITWVIIFFLACDGLLTAAAMLRYTDRQNNPEPKNVAEAFLDDTYDDNWMEHHWPNMVVTKDAES